MFCLRMSTLMFTLGWVCLGVPFAVADSSDIGLMGEQSSQKCEFPAQDADEPPCKI